LAVLAAPLLAAPQGGKDAPLAAYREQIPGSEIGFDMQPIPAGKFRMGSPETERGRNVDEGPAIEVAVDAFWMGRCEVTWDEYDQFNTDPERPQAKKPDGMSRPTPAYTEMTFGMGREGYPAIGMSHIAAREYCAWLSRKTGKFYRLPTEAEWEYACRAGSTTAYSFGDDPDGLDAHAFHAGNSGRELEPGAAPKPAYHKVGLKRPNAWGLCDMHGNVAEWVADTFLADAYAEAHGTTPRGNPYFPPGRDAKDRPIRFPHTLRGGSYQDAPAALRSAARRPSEPGWNQRDPQIPKSWWYLTEGQHLGFRVVRPVREPTAAERQKFESP
jgi:formylglycine-generating enzyme required for sulfatase activity